MPMSEKQFTKICGYIRAMRFMTVILWFGILTLAFSMGSCESKTLDGENPGGPDPVMVFPPFITPNDLYFDTRLDGIPAINSEAYRLKISGAIDHPSTYTLRDLLGMDLVKRTLTVECIGNLANGPLLGTAEWRGFRVYDLLYNLGIQEDATTVKYKSADGYFTFNTLEELKNNKVLGALYMNDESIPPLYGYPLRIIFPGYFGVRQPGWIVEIELLETGPEDYWSGSGWKSDSSMAVDSKIFFPTSKSRFALGDSIRIGGAALGARRISKVEVTLDEGNTWIPATIRQSLDEDFVWLFWEVTVTPLKAGDLRIRSRATAEDGSVQPESDNNYLDGINSWPSVSVTVSE
jgi:DMSO/TMAO reductase YedYZ molybdopterin-dependent catalytic subunit